MWSCTDSWAFLTQLLPAAPSVERRKLRCSIYPPGGRRLPLKGGTARCLAAGHGSGYCTALVQATKIVSQSGYGIHPIPLLSRIKYTTYIYLQLHFATCFIYLQLYFVTCFIQTFFPNLLNGGIHKDRQSPRLSLSKDCCVDPVLCPPIAQCLCYDRI